MKRYLLGAGLLFTCSLALGQHQLTYLKNTCNDQLFKGLTLDQAYSLVHFDKSNDFKEMLSYTYCQQEYALDDPINDYLMIERAKLTGKMFGSSMFNNESETLEKFEQDLTSLYDKYGADKNNYFRNKSTMKKQFDLDCDESAVNVDFCYEHNDKEIVLSNNFGKDKWKRPVKIKPMIDGILNIISKKQKNGISPKKGIVHKWSPEFKKWRKGKIINPISGDEKKINIALRFSKLLTALSTGTTSIFLKTGTEEGIKSWLLDQEDNSVDIYKIFEESYTQNRGDIYLTLLAIENVLSADWLSMDRNSLPWIKKLKPITYQKEGIGDNYGAWYHFWGMAIFSYVKGKATADTFALLEAFISLFDRNNPISNDIQEMHLNFGGAKLGAKLRKVVRKKLWEGFLPEKLNWTHQDYMR